MVSIHYITLGHSKSHPSVCGVIFDTTPRFSAKITTYGMFPRQYLKEVSTVQYVGNPMCAAVVMCPAHATYVQLVCMTLISPSQPPHNTMLKQPSQPPHHIDIISVLLSCFLYITPIVNKALDPAFSHSLFSQLNFSYLAHHCNITVRQNL